jgi:ribosome production factor 2
VFGRTFGGHVLDMFELQIVGYKPQDEFDGPSPSLGNHPLVVFQGGDWETGRDLPVLRNLFLDMFRGDSMGGDLSLSGVERTVSISAVDGVIYLRQYMLDLKNAGVRTPHVELNEVGPRMAFTMKRCAVADEDARQAASQQPRKARAVKNVEKGFVGEKLGRLHLQRQDLGELERKTRLPKALRAPKRPAEEAEPSGKRVKAADEAGAASDDE